MKDVARYLKRIQKYYVLLIIKMVAEIIRNKSLPKILLIFFVRILKEYLIKSKSIEKGLFACETKEANFLTLMVSKS